MDQHYFPEKEGYEKPPIRCQWCGNPEVSFLWSGFKAQYCSFRCNAGGTYPRSVVISILMTGLTTMFLLIVFMMQSNYPSTPLPTAFGIILAVPIILNSLFIYAAYVGRSMVKERQSRIRQDR
ncbi:MAG: hypothetical protein ACFFEE_09515 [Candidatus Thorarchaeota archaeon]